MSEGDLYISNRGATLEHLRSFVAVIDDNGFASAGQKLHRTQSAITQNVRKLEEIVGCRLLERKQGRIIGLTSEGQRLFPQAKEILSKVNVALNAVQRPQMAGSVKLGVPDDFDVSDIYSALSSCMQMNPNLRIDVRSALSQSINIAVDASELDVAIFRSTDPIHEISGYEITELSCDSIDWIYNKRVCIDSFSDLPLVLYSEGCAFRYNIMKYLVRIEKKHRVAYSSYCTENIMQAISSGLGVGVVPSKCIGPDHVVLGCDEGFPPLPKARLMLAVKSTSSIYQEFSNYLIRSCKLA